MIAARDNPFAVRRVHALGYQPQGCDWDSIDRRLAMLQWRAAITGPHGSGKTTLLEHLAVRLREGGVAVEQLFISEDVTLSWRTIRRTMRSLPAGGVLLFDGACHLGWWRWGQVKRLATRRKIGLVITSHNEGMLATLIRCETSVGLLADLVGQLDASAFFDQEKLCALYKAHAGNLRDCLRQLYDEYAVGGSLAEASTFS